ncbi:MAG TPA: [FeFe] hydrogenase H-cluster radical SAM maturase HydE [Prolixibacteraceae bacterium]|nr:[FeFe] hydrogenase H-cluster radical SAM maturase HydE [Prolixibacteraceae bacterium]
MLTVAEIIEQKLFSRENLVTLLRADGEEGLFLLRKAGELKLQTVGNKVYFRGLIELSNVCEKDCFYCGIRRSNSKVKRYNLTDEELLEAARFASREKYGSIVIQSGEVTNESFAARIERLILQIKSESGNKLGITLSLGEQSEEVYKRWFAAGAHRYLLRIESSNPELYRRLHPDDGFHRYEQRLEALNLIRKTGYQTGTGVMIGTPSQTLEDLAGDLLFFRDFDIDMVGMGPFIEHDDTPYNQPEANALSLTDRFNLSLKMVAILRLMMPDINIAATTALQAIDPLGREKAVKAGANIIMPNITPGKYRNNYLLYNNKPCTGEEPEQCTGCLDARLALADSDIGYGEWGDSPHFRKKQ